jgi:flagellar hook-basal body complex protein FliE
MSLIGSVSGFFNKQTPGQIELGGLGKAGQIGQPGQIDMAELAGSTGVGAPRTTPATGAVSFGAIMDNLVGEVNAKMQAGSAEQAKVLSGESTNLHQAMISMQEASVAFSLMVEVRNKLVESYQEIMRMQV